MARIIGDQIKPDWCVVRYETPEDFKHSKDKSGVYELCKGLITLDDEFNPMHTISYVIVQMSANYSRVRLKITPCTDGTPGLEDLVAKINHEFIDDEWHEFPNYEEMVRTVAADYDEWLQYACEKEAWDSEQLWSSTDAGYTLVFPIWRDVDKIIKNSRKW